MQTKYDDISLRDVEKTAKTIVSMYIYTYTNKYYADIRKNLVNLFWLPFSFLLIVRIEMYCIHDSSFTLGTIH
jgi:hypothetical protein